MGIDLDAVKKKLAVLSGEGGTQEYIWKPPAGKTTVRIVPYKYNKNFPFIELWFHYGLKKYGILSPSSFD